jgi:type I restriction enzyme S subunit
MTRLATGASYPAVTDRIITDSLIPFPDYNEQRRIANILDKADEIRWKRRETVGLLDDLNRSAFYEMFGDPVAGKKRWRTKKLGLEATLDRGRSRHRPRDASFLYGGPYPFIQTGDVANANGYITKYTQTYSEAGLAQSKLWPAGTLCITIAANIAKTAVLTFDACFPDSVVGLVPGERLRTEYVRYWFVAMEKAIDATATQVAQKNINLELLRELEIQLAPTELQDRYSALVRKNKEVRERNLAANAESDNLFESLMQRAFRGEL